MDHYERKVQNAQVGQYIYMVITKRTPLYLSNILESFQNGDTHVTHLQAHVGLKTPRCQKDAYLNSSLVSSIGL